jgi:hypothetical protein
MGLNAIQAAKYPLSANDNLATPMPISFLANVTESSSVDDSIVIKDKCLNMTAMVSTDDEGLLEHNAASVAENTDANSNTYGDNAKLNSSQSSFATVNDWDTNDLDKAYDDLNTSLGFPLDPANNNAQVTLFSVYI